MQSKELSMTLLSHRKNNNRWTRFVVFKSSSDFLDLIFATQVVAVVEPQQTYTYSLSFKLFEFCLLKPT